MRGSGFLMACSWTSSTSYFDSAIVLSLLIFKLPFPQFSFPLRQVQSLFKALPDQILKLIRILEWALRILLMMLSILFIFSATIILFTVNQELLNNIEGCQVFICNFKICCIMSIVLRLLVLLALAFGAVNGKKVVQQVEELKKTKVSFLIGKEKNTNKQILKLNLKISQRDVSLADAIQKSTEVKQELEALFIDFCTRVEEDDCQDLTESTEYEIEAEYYRLRGQQVFKTFVVTFQMDFTVSKFQLIGVLLDDFEDIIEENQIVIGGIEWEEQNEKLSMEELIDQAEERAKKSCGKLGMVLQRFKSIQYFEEEEEKPEEKPKKEEGDQEEEEQEEEQEEEEEQGDEEEHTIRYKFVALCKQKPKPKKLSLKTIINSKGKQSAKKSKIQ